MSNTYTQIYIQVVFAVEERQNLIRAERKEELQKYITGIVTAQGQKLLAIHCMPDHTHLLIGQYKTLAVAAYTLFGLGLAFYATPSTDAALSNLPDDQAGSGSGIYKMASSLGASFGVAISAAIFTALSVDRESARWLEGVITFAGRQDNVAVRQAALIALAFNLLMVVAAIVSIMLTVPKGRTRGDW